MKRINIIGPPGSGKSVLAREISRILDLPVIHIDRIGHTERFHAIDNKTAFRRKIKRMSKKEEWIMEGIYKSTLPNRIKSADVTIYLDFPRKVYLYRVFKRRFQHRSKPREDMPDGWKERIDWEFFKFIWSFHKKQKYKIDELLEQYSTNNIVILHSKSEVEDYLHQLT